MLVTILGIVMVFAAGALFGSTLKVHEDNKMPDLKLEYFSSDYFQDHKEFDPLSKAGVYITDRLLEELCEAVDADYVELPSFGTVDIRSPTQLKQVYWRAVEADEYIYKEP